MKQQLLELRIKMKDKKPHFMRQDTHKRRKLPLRWKKPKGLHSKIKHKFKGHMKMPSPGYKSPAKVRGLHSTGLQSINVASVQELSKIKKESQGIIVSGKVGAKKRLDILRAAKEKGIQVLNINMDEHISKIESFVASKKKKETKPAKKEEPKKAAEKKEETKEAPTQTDQEKKDAEKQERDKVLTKRT